MKHRIVYALVTPAVMTLTVTMSVRDEHSLPENEVVHPRDRHGKR